MKLWVLIWKSLWVFFNNHIIICKPQSPENEGNIGQMNFAVWFENSTIYFLYQFKLFWFSRLETECFSSDFTYSFIYFIYLFTHLFIFNQIFSHIILSFWEVKLHEDSSLSSSSPSSSSSSLSISFLSYVNLNSVWMSFSSSGISSSSESSDSISASSGLNHQLT